MPRRFAELDFRSTPRGEISLRRRFDPTLDAEVHEVLLGDEYLMSSAFVVGEQELARLALARVPGPGPLQVVVGGLGLGYTAAAVLDDGRVAAMSVVDAFEPVLDWNRRRLLPVSGALLDDGRARLVHGDFFAGLADVSAWGLAPDVRADAVLVDIDHSPRHLLHPDHAVLYAAAGLQALAERLQPHGVLGLWSDDPPDQEFLDALGSAFPVAEAHTVRFGNPYTGGSSANTVYLAGDLLPRG